MNRQASGRCRRARWISARVLFLCAFVTLAGLYLRQLLLAPAPRRLPACREHWLAFDGWCYRVAGPSSNASKARALCAAQGAELVPALRTHVSVVARVLSQTRFWIDAHQISGRWLDSQSKSLGWTGAGSGNCAAAEYGVFIPRVCSLVLPVVCAVPFYT